MKEKMFIGSEPSLEKMELGIQKYFFWNEPAVLKEIEKDIWSIYYPNTHSKAGQQLKYVVRKCKNRYRLELI